MTGFSPRMSRCCGLPKATARLTLTPQIQIVGAAGNCDDGFRVAMEQQPDGSWQISACAIVRAPDMST